MSYTFRTTVYVVDTEYEFLWCDYEVRLHTLVELRYRVIAYQAAKHASPRVDYNKGARVAASNWRKTPKEARDDIALELDLHVGNENIVMESTFKIPIPLPSLDL